MSEACHDWFGLTYSSYLVLYRSILQSMPDEWQTRFVAMLEELQEAYGDQMPKFTYQVRARSGGKFAADPLADYSRGRRRIPRTMVKRSASGIALIDAVDAAKEQP